MKQCNFQDYLFSQAPLCFDRQLNTISFKDFWQDVQQQTYIVAQQNQQKFALWQSDSYDFLVLFFATLMAQKTVILPPNKVASLEQYLLEDGIVFLERQSVQGYSVLNTDRLLQSQIIFFTSGSTGQPKQISRTLQQLLNEVEGLNASFNLPQNSVAIATVSHQHIYGLLFKVLWPLSTGRSFYREQLLYPEYVVQFQQQLFQHEMTNHVISSPALLKRWPQDIQLYHSNAIYSSGGRLEHGARQNLNIPITEVFGSSETGGIAYRSEDHAAWQPFANVEVKVESNHQLQVRSSHAFQDDWVLTGDRVELKQANCLQSRFELLGRVDRIIKLEEKRLSLDEVEQKILSLEVVQQCHILLINTEHRQFLGCVVVLTEDARRQYDAHKKHTFVMHLKQQLKPILETIAIPRRWRFLSKLPVNSQSKLNKKDLTALFSPLEHPVILAQHTEQDHHHFELEFLPELICFKGHFEGNPVYPGVGQIAFLQAFACEIWLDLQWCQGYEQLKFQEIIRPHQIIHLVLSRKAHKVLFKMTTDEKPIASGRLLFACQNEDA